MVEVLAAVVAAAAEVVAPAQPVAAAGVELEQPLVSYRQRSNPEWRTEHRPAERVA
jgi:hypothetical protein